MRALICIVMSAIASSSAYAFAAEPTETTNEVKMVSSLVFEVKDQLIEADRDLEALDVRSGTRHLREAAALIVLQADRIDPGRGDLLKSDARKLSDLARSISDGEARYENELSAVTASALFNLAESYHRRFISLAATSDLNVAGEYLVGAALNLKGALIRNAELISGDDAALIKEATSIGYELQDKASWTAQQTNIAATAFKGVLEKNRCKLTAC